MRPLIRAMIRWSGKLACVGACVGAVYLATIAVPPAVAQQQSRQADLGWIERRLVGYLESLSGYRIRIGASAGSLLGGVIYRRIELLDARGVFARIGEVRLDWSARRLLSGEIQVNDLTVSDVRILRLPERRRVPQQDLKPPKVETRTVELPFVQTRIELPISVNIKKMALRRVQFDKAVAGAAAAFTMEGRAYIEDDGSVLDIDLRLVRLSGAAPEGRIRIALPKAKPGTPARLTVDVKLQDRPGGLITRALSLKPEESVELVLGGNGPLNRWRGQVRAGAGDLAGFEATITADAAPAGYRVRIEGKGRSSLLSGELAVFGRDIFLLYDATYGAEQVEIHQLQVRGAAARVALAGRASTDGKTINLTALVEAADLSKFRRLTGLPLAGPGRMEVSVAGRMAAPTLKLTGRVGRAVLGRFVISDGRLSVDLTPGAQATALGQGTVRMSLTADRVVVRGPKGRARPLQAFSVTLSGDLDWPAGTIDLKSLVASADTATLTASGRVARLTPLRFAGKVRFSGDLAADLLGGASLTGTSLDGSVSLDEAAGTGQLDLKASIADLKSGSPSLDALIGGRAEARVTARWSPDRIDVADLRLTAGAVTLRGGGALSRTKGSRFELALRVPDIAPLSGSLGMPLRGALNVSGVVSGAGSGVNARLNGSGSGVVVGGIKFGQLTLRVVATGISDTAGRADLRLTTKGGQWPANLRLSLRRLNGDTVRIDLPGARVGGARVTARGRLNIRHGLFDGRVRVATAALGRLLRPFGIRAGGSLVLSANLASRQGRQFAIVSANGRRLRIGAGPSRTSVAAAVARLAIGDLSNLANVSGRVRLQGVVAGDLAAPRLDLNLRRAGQGSRFDIRGRVAFRNQPMTLSAAGLLRRRPPTTALRFDRLALRARRLSLVLAQPADLRFGRGVFEARGVRVRVASGRGKTRRVGSIAGDYRQRFGRVRGRARMVALPARLLQYSGVANPAHGQIDGTVAFGGTVWRPELVFDVRATGVRRAFAPASAALNFSATGRMAAGRLSATGQLRAAGRPERLNFRVQSRAGRRAVTEARITGKVDLAALSNSGLFWAHRISGTLSADLTVTAGAGAPQASGSVQLADGRFVHAVTGAVLRDIKLEARGDGRQIRIISMSANDGTGGRLSGTGQLLVDARAGYPFTLEILAQRIAVARREDLELVVSGRLRVSKAQGRPVMMTGRMTVDRGELLIPEGGRASIPRLKVIEIHRKGRGGRSGRAARGPQSGGVAPPLRLDLEVNIPRRLFVRGRGIEVEVQGALRVRGTSASPQVRGGLRTIRGRLTLLTARFDFRRGSLRFTNPSLANPALNLEAVASDNGVTATITVSGTARRPKFALTSSPALPQDQILARLLFGKDATQMTTSEAVQLAAAVATLFGPGGGGIINRLRRTTGLDLVDVETGADGNPRVVAGKYVTDRVLVKVEQGITPNSSAAGVEVEVTRNIRVEAKSTTTGRQRVGIKWRYDY